MIETFIGKSQKGDGFRSDETCRSGLSSIVHDEVFMFRKDKREIEVKRSRCREDGGSMKWVGRGQLGGAVEGPPWGTSS